MISERPKTDAQRSAALAERKKKEGMVKVSVSAWVPEGKADACRSAAKKAIEKAVKNKS